MENLHTKDRLEYLRKLGFVIHMSDSRVTKLHSHSFLEFTYIESGMMEHTFDGEIATLKAGDYFIVDYGTRHQYRAVGDTKLNVINFLFYPDFVDRTLGRSESFEKVVNSYFIRFRYQSLNCSPTGIAFHDDDGEIYKIVQQITKEYAEEKEGFLECIRCLVVQMFIIIMRKIGRCEGAKNESTIIQEITEYMKNNYAERISLSDMAKRYNYSLSHISKKFAEEMGCGFTQYLQRIRIEQSCRLLETGEYLVREVAELVGYGDIKFFNKVFKDTLGITPREFKKLKHYR